jgi:predicted ATPase/Tfp pilus assembly protein PilF
MQRERFRIQMLDALEKLTAYHLRRSEEEEALPYARRQLEIDPLREQAYLQIMQIHVAQGDRSGALRQYDRCCSVLGAELGVEPSIEIRELHQQILATTALTVSIVVPPTHADAERSQPQLPVYLTPFVGRQGELALLTARIRAGDYRLITLVGQGGMGKTRLAVEAARQQNTHFADGVYFVPCAAVHTVAAVADSLAAALGITYRADGRPPQVQLLDWLRPRHLLLVIDNFEQIPAAAPLLVEILQAAPQVVILITSREPLGVQAEDLIHVTGLSFPASAQEAEASHFAAVRLFVDRAYRIDKRFHLNEENVADVVRICRLVAGQPLALELAAAQTVARTCRAIVEAINADFNFLRADLPDLPVRHQSLGAIFEYSWQALTPLEQSSFGRLSIFCNPFSIEAAIAVAGASLAILTRLHRVHLLQRHDDFERFSVHELLRNFAAAKLTQSLPDPAMLQHRHAEYFLTWLSRHGQILEGIQPMHCVEVIQTYLDDVRFAWQWASTAHAVELLQRALPVLGAFYALRGAHGEAEVRFRETLAQLGEADEELSAQLLAQLGASLEKQGKVEASQGALESAIAIAQRYKDYQTIGFAHLAMARLLVSKGSISTAIQFLRSGLAELPEGEFLTIRAELLLYLGTAEGRQLHHAAAAVALNEVRRLVARTGNKVQQQRLLLYQAIENAADNYVAARFHYERALALCPATGDRSLEARILNGLGFVLANLGNYDEAIHCHLRGLALAIADQDAVQQTFALHNLCVCYDGQGNALEAYRHGQESLAIAERNQLSGSIAYAQLHLGHVLAKMHLYHEAKHTLLAARESFVRSGEAMLELEAEAGVAHVSRLQGELPAALARVERVFDYLKTHTLAGCDDPSRVYLHCYQIFHAGGDRRAAELLTAAYRYIRQRADLLDPDARTRYLTAVAANRQIMEIWNELAPPERANFREAAASGQPIGYTELL